MFNLVTQYINHSKIGFQEFTIFVKSEVVSIVNMIHIGNTLLSNELNHLFLNCPTILDCPHAFFVVIPKNSGDKQPIRI